MTYYKKEKGFDAQCFELFLYMGDILEKMEDKSFDAQCFELFLYTKSGFDKVATFRGFDAQCFELFLYDLKKR